MSPHIRSTRFLTHLAVSLSLATLWLHPHLQQRALVPITIALLWPAMAIPSPVQWQRWRRAWTALLTLTAMITLPLMFVLPWLRLDLLTVLIATMLVRWAHCPSGARQQRLMLGVGLIPLVMSSLASDSVWLPLLGAPCAILLIASLIMTEINANIERTPPLPEELPRCLDRTLALRLVSLLALAIALVAAGLFTLFPRVGASHAATQSSARESFALTGMSEWVETNSFAPLLRDPSPVLRVTPLDPLLAEPTYLRGGALPDLVRFSDETWRWTRERVVVASAEAKTNTVTALTDAPPTDTLRHRIELLDPSLRTLFAPPWLVAIEGQGGVINCEPGERWRFPHRNATWPIYTAHVAPGRSPQTTLSGTERQRLLHLPEDMSERIRDHIVQSGITTLMEEPGQRAQAIVHHLRTNHLYTLDATASSARNPIIDFIFNDLAGHCEQFASAMTAMCRSVRVPARLVTGFHGGERQGEGSILFRRSDAHAWVEIWIDGQGWLQMDPTPPAHRSTEVGGLMADVADNARGRWRAMVVNYQGLWHRDVLQNLGSHGEQIMMGGTMESGAMGRAIQKMRLNLTQEQSLWVFITLLLLLHASLHWTLRRWRHIGPPWRRMRSHHEILLHRLAKTLTPRARPRHIGETPSEYLRVVAKANIEPQPLQELISDYYRSRFSTTSGEVSEAEILRSAKALATLSR